MPTAYINRDMEKVLKTSSRQFPSVIVTGPRQSGKTTLVKHLFSRSHRYVSMDNPDLRLMATDEPELFFENYPPPVIIDEVQYTPQIFSYIKLLIDKNRKDCGQFILTGSQLFPLMAKVGDSLAGRIAVFTLLSFSFREQFGRRAALTVNTLKKRILTGGLPEVILGRGMDLEVWFGSYLQTYLERDVRQLRQIGSLGDFQRFLQLVAAFNGQALNLSGISRDLGVTVNTIKAWVSILEASGQIVLIKPFYRNKGKRIVKRPRIYFLDTGLLCYLTGITDIKQIFRGPLSGQLLETVVAGEIIRNFYNRGRIPRIFWWRTSYGDEVDFVVEDKGKILPVEVKTSSKVNKQMARGLISFCRLFPEMIDRALLVNLSREKMILDKKITSVPFTDFIRQP
ncbi:ATP-binding protein [bacterium]|nr:ATP-binding protein [bacterium]